MSQQNASLVRRAIEEIWNRGNYALLDEYVADDLVIHATTSDQELHGTDGVVRFYGMLRSAFPDLQFEVNDQIAERDRVVTRWTASGTHQGDFQGIPPTGKRITMTGIDIDRLVDGKVVECWPQVDELSLLQQLGAIAEPASAAR